MAVTYEIDQHTARGKFAGKFIESHMIGGKLASHLGISLGDGSGKVGLGDAEFSFQSGASMDASSKISGFEV